MSTFLRVTQTRYRANKTLLDSLRIRQAKQLNYTSPIPIWTIPENPDQVLDKPHVGINQTRAGYL